MPVGQMQLVEARLQMGDICAFKNSSLIFFKSGKQCKHISVLER